MPARRAKQNAAYCIRVGPKIPGRSLYVVGFVYPPPKRAPAAVGEIMLRRPDGTPWEVAIATHCYASIGPGPRAYGWSLRAGAEAAKTIAGWLGECGELPPAKVIYVADYKGQWDECSTASSYRDGWRTVGASDKPEV